MTTAAEMPLTISVEEAARLLGVSRGLAYGMAHAGELPVIRLGQKRIRVPYQRFLEMFEAKIEVRAA